MSSKRAAIFMIVLKTLTLVKSEDEITVSALVPIDRCTDTYLETDTHFLCKLDDCTKWISFSKCPLDEVSTGEMNMAKKCLNCKKINSTNTNDVHQGLLNKSMCDPIFSQGEIFRCQYEHCWFSFIGCDKNEIPTEYLNFKEKRLVCQRKETTSNSGLHNVTAPTTKQLTSMPHSGQVPIQASVITLLYLLFLVLGLKYY